MFLPLRHSTLQQWMCCTFHRLTEVFHRRRYQGSQALETEACVGITRRSILYASMHGSSPSGFVPVSGDSHFSDAGVGVSIAD